MTDRELLEAAAKAAGLETFWHGWSERFMVTNHVAPSGLIQADYPWNPLTDDGDALRLAVRLNFAVSVAAREAGNVTVFDDFGVQVFERLGDDPCGATRRAIVRAAAMANPIPLPSTP